MITTSNVTAIIITVTVTARNTKKIIMSVGVDGGDGDNTVGITSGVMKVEPIILCVRSIAMHDEGMLLTMNSYISEQILYLLCVTSIDKLEMCCGTSILRHSNFDPLRLNEISTEH